MVSRDPSREANVQSTDDGLTLTRRTALGLLGAGTVGAATTGRAAADHGGNGDEVRPWNQHVDAQGHDLRNLHGLEVDHVYSAARDADVIVWKDDEGVFHADGYDGHVTSGTDVMAVTQAAVDSLTDGRTTAEKVAVVSSGTVAAETAERRTIELPSYTVLDVPATIHVEYEPGEHSNDVVVRARNETHVEIPRLNVTGGPWMAVRIMSCSNVTLGRIDVRFGADSNANDAVRIDGHADAGRTTDVQLDAAYIENGTQHAVETYGVDRVQIGQVLARGTEGCAVLLNDTHAATIDSVVGYNPESETRYATFRVANEVENVSCGQVVSTDAPRGVHISDGRDITIGTVNIHNPRTLGIAADSTVENAIVQGGLIKNCTQEGIRSDTQGFAVSNVRVYDDRPEGDREQPVAIRITGDHSSVVNCDVRDGGTERLLDITADDTVVRDNIGDGIDSGTVTLESGADPAAGVEGVSDNPAATLDLRASAVETPAGSCAWDHRFEWDGDAERWDLRFEWRTDPGADLTLEYIVDQPQANLGLERKEDWDHDTSPGIVDSFESGALEAYDGDTDAYAITDEPPIAHGDARLASDAGVAPIISTDGLDRYPAAGTTFSAKIGRTADNPHMGIAFGAQSTDEFYFVRVSPDLDDPRFQLYSGSSGNLFSVEPTADIETGTLYELVVDWGEDGEIAAALFDPDGTEVASGSATDTDFTAGGIGTRGSALLDEIRILQS